MNTPQLRPTGGHILIQYPKQEAVIEKGVLIPISNQNLPHEATIMALGSGTLDTKGKHLPFAVSVGERVLMSASSGMPVNFDGQRYAMVVENDILAVLE